ncbi:MAG: toprim domain-containing protein [Patescibacteria group bacterium]|nr:toprim domain-containing protein [Patescibacteria group bacterium]MDE2439035.1 toprim domain-containing protein [Patescibacteria group bacterium]
MNLLRALDSRNVLYRQHQTNLNEISICCPFCEERKESEDTRFRLGINIQNGLAHCFNCGWKARAPYTWEALNRVFNVTLESAFGEVDVAQEEEEKEHQQIFEPLPQGFCLLRWQETLKAPLDEFEAAAKVYLERRGVTEKQVRQKKIGYCTSGKFAYRILFPVWDETKKFCGVVGRDWTGKQKLRYLNSKGLEKVFYNAHKMAKWTGQVHIYLAEGIFDALALERAGEKSVALLGSSLTESQLSSLQKFININLMADADGPGLVSILKTADILSDAEKRVKVIFPINGKKDAAEMLDGEIKKALTQNNYSYDAQLAFRIRHAEEKLKMGEKPFWA